MYSNHNFQKKMETIYVRRTEWNGSRLSKIFVTILRSRINFRIVKSVGSISNTILT